MITYSFADIGSDSLYIHLYKCIKNDILQGILQAGETLPSKRSLAKNLNISVITIENAYAQLIAEGYVYSIPKKGFFGQISRAYIRKRTPFFPQKTYSFLPVNLIILQILPVIRQAPNTFPFLYGQNLPVNY